MNNELSGAERFQLYIGRVREGLNAANMMVGNDCAICFDDLPPKEIETLCRDTAMVAAGLFHWASILQDKIDDMRG